MPQPMTLEVDLRKLEQHPLFNRKWNDRALDIIERGLKRMFLDALKLMQDAIIPKLPRGATGLLKQSYASSEVRGRGLDVIGIFGSDLKYAPEIEHGTKPHYVAPKDLELWVRRVLDVPFDEVTSVAFAVSRKISREGTKAQNQVNDFMDKNENKIIAGMFPRMTETMEAAILGQRWR
jgi:hypothetical protein